MLSNSAGQLRSFIERIERLNEEEKTIKDDKRDVYAEAKSMGFDAKAMRKIVQLRGTDPSEREEFESIVETYMHALGMLPAHAGDARDATEQDQEAPAPNTAQAKGVTGERPEEGDDDCNGGASPADEQVYAAVQSSQFGTGDTGEGESVDAGIPAPPISPSPGQQPIDLTIPAFLRKGTPENAALTGQVQP